MRCRVLLLSVFFAGSSLWACSVPTFRYALEKWQPDPYRVTVFHDGGLSEADRKTLEQLEYRTSLIDQPVNLQVRTVNVRELKSKQPADAELLSLWQKQNSTASPHLLIQYPEGELYEGIDWLPDRLYSGAFKPEVFNTLVDSPKRQEIAKLLAAGETGVWVLLESGDRTADDQAAQSLQDQLTELERTLKLPELDEQDVKDGILTIPPDELKLSFRMLRVSRTDAAEKLFVEMLLHSEEDLTDVDEPMVFPVFGRGRVLYALIGDAITKPTAEVNAVAMAARQLIAPCSCTVKRQNPGTDLLLAFDWNKHVKSQLAVDTALPELPGLSGFGAPQELPAVLTIGENQIPAEQASSLSGVVTAHKDPVGPIPSPTPQGLAAGLSFTAVVLIAVLVLGTVLLFIKK